MTFLRFFISEILFIFQKIDTIYSLFYWTNCYIFYSCINIQKMIKKISSNLYNFPWSCDRFFNVQWNTTKMLLKTVTRKYILASGFCVIISSNFMKQIQLIMHKTALYHHEFNSVMKLFSVSSKQKQTKQKYNYPL